MKTELRQRFAILAALLAGAVLLAAPREARAAPPDWDRGLPSLELRQVAIEADSLEDAWQRFSTRHLVRSILFVRAGAGAGGATAGHFSFKAERCRVREVLDKLVAAYPGYAWTAAPRSHVLWIHPAGQGWDAALGGRVRVPRAYCSVPMQTGLLEPLREAPGMRVTPTTWGTAFTNTFDYAVQVPAGDHRLGELLELACKPHPSKTFYLRMRGDTVQITAVNLVSSALEAPPAGALRWWEEHFGRRTGGPPRPAELVHRLASTSAVRRQAARAYLEAVIYQTDTGALLGKAASPHDAFWTAVGVSSVLVRHSGATETASAARLAGELDGLIRAGRLDLAWLAAFQLAALGQDGRVLDRLAGKRLAPQRLAPMIDDVMRLANSSEPVRTFLAANLATRPSAAAVTGCLGAGPVSLDAWPGAVAYTRAEP